MRSTLQVPWLGCAWKVGVSAHWIRGMLATSAALTLPFDFGFDTFCSTPQCGCSANTNCGCLQDIKTCDVGHYKGNESKMVFPCQQYYHRSPAAPAIQAWPGKSKDNDQEFLIDRFEEFLNSTIEDASTGKRSPFLASVDFHSVHIPYVATPKYRSMYAAKGFSSNEQDYYGALTEMDEQIGRLRQLLVVHGVANDTMLFFTVSSQCGMHMPVLIVPRLLALLHTVGQRARDFAHGRQ